MLSCGNANDGVNYKRPLSCALSTSMWCAITDPKLCDIVVLMLPLLYVNSWCACFISVRILS